MYDVYMYDMIQCNATDRNTAQFIQGFYFHTPPEGMWDRLRRRVRRRVRPISELRSWIPDFDSSLFLILRGGVPRPVGNRQEIETRRSLVCGFLVRGLYAYIHTYIYIYIHTYVCI